MATAQTEFRHISLDEAAKAAEAENKLIFIDIYTSWCGPCKMMASKTFPQKEVGDYMNKTFVCVKFDAEKDDGPEVAKLYDVKAYPTFIIATPDKKELNRVLGYYGADKWIEKLQQVVQPENSPVRLRKRYANGERTAEVVKGLAYIIDDDMRMMYQGKERDSLENMRDNMVNSYFNSLDDNSRMDVKNLFIFKEYAYDINSSQFKFMVANRSKFTGEHKEIADKVIAAVYHDELMEALTHGKYSDATAYEALKKAIADGGLNADGKYDTAYQMIETYAKGDLDKYLAFCQKNFKKLPADQVTPFLENFAERFKDGTDEQRAKLCKYLRSLLPDLPIRPLYRCASEISKMEKD